MARVAWNGEPEWRNEVCELVLGEDGLAATGAQLGAEPTPYRAVYEIEARRNWVTRRLRVEVGGVGSLELRHDGKGMWAGVPNAGDLEGVLDCDLAFSPLTNLMPIRRHRLHEQPGTVDFEMAWVSLPDLKVHRSQQRYEHLEPGRVRFSSDGFTADLELDEDGVVVFYPELARRVGLVRSLAPPGTGLTLQLVAGTYVVLLGMSVEAAQVDGLLGFCVERVDHTEADVRTLENPLMFEHNDGDHSSERNPIQAFVWGDYAAKPEHTYTYTVTAMYGTPAQPTRGASVHAQVTTETPDDGTHGVFFNRGVAASDAYQARFKDVRPDQVPNREAYRWLSRGLEEALLAFIGQAVDGRFALRAAMYEFEYPPVLGAFKIAADAGADVKIVVDNVKGRDTARDNTAAIAAAGIGHLTIPRTKISIAHNKFVVLLRDRVPVEVWTGSTNITEGGIFGHANVGHLVRDRVIAERYLRYWKRLAQNPERKDFRAFNDPAPSFRATRPRRGNTPTVFSPRSALDSLEWYVRLADSADQAVFLTAAFGLTAEIAPAFAGQRSYLRYLLLDTFKGQVEAVRREPGNVVSAGGFEGSGAYRTWIAKALRHLNRLDYIHTKLMLVDPLTSDPLIVTGSANWSDESSKVNDENMLIIRGDQRAADIYLTDFMRLFNHYRLRGTSRKHLAPDDSWARPFYVAGSPEEKERLLFCG